jgi:hypothetical protein
MGNKRRNRPKKRERLMLRPQPAGAATAPSGEHSNLACPHTATQRTDSVPKHAAAPGQPTSKYSAFLCMVLLRGAYYM